MRARKGGRHEVATVGSKRVVRRRSCGSSSATAEPSARICGPTPDLLARPARQRSGWVLLGSGKGVHWPELDEDVSVDIVLATGGTIVR
jgi:hypothetical protein